MYDHIRTIYDHIWSIYDHARGAIKLSRVYIKPLWGVQKSYSQSSKQFIVNYDTVVYFTYVNGASGSFFLQKSMFGLMRVLHTTLDIGIFGFIVFRKKVTSFFKNIQNA